MQVVGERQASTKMERRYRVCQECRVASNGQMGVKDQTAAARGSTLLILVMVVSGASSSLQA